MVVSFKLGNICPQCLALLLRKSLHRSESCQELKIFSLSNACDSADYHIFHNMKFCLNSM